MRNARTFLVAVALVGGLVALPAVADAQSRGGSPHGGGGGGGGGGAPHGGAAAPGPGHAVPRPPGSVPGGGPVYGHGGGYYGHYPYYGYGYGYPYYGYPYYGPGWSFSLGFAYGYPWGWGSVGWGYPYPAYGYPAPYAAYPSGDMAAQAYGGVRIDVPQHDAEVYVDGYFTGTVDDFNGRNQDMHLPQGQHHIELRAPGFEPAAFDVNVEPGRTISYRTSLIPARQ